MVRSNQGTEAYDVVVVGGGGAGMASAVAAKEANRNVEVVVLQKGSELGGSTTLSVGSFSAAETSLQRAADIDDDADLHFDDLGKFVDMVARDGGRNFYLDFEGDLTAKDNLDLRRVMVENGGETLDWLIDHGCDYRGPYHERPHSVPRIYQIDPDTEAYANVLGEAMEDIGVEVRLDTRATELLKDDDAIRGVRTTRTDDDDPRDVLARRGVVLAAGDYVNGRDLRAKYTTDAESRAINPENTGDGHRMAEAVGAQLVNMDMQWLGFRFGAPLWTSPEYQSFVERGAILVNARGERFVNEAADYDQVYRAALRQPDDAIYVVFDDPIARSFDDWPDHVSTFGKAGKVWGYIDDYREYEVLGQESSIAELAREEGMEPTTLKGTLVAYNDGIADATLETTRDPYGRVNARPLDDPPYYSLGPAYAFDTIADGGVKVDTQFRVLDGEGETIPRLYAAGVMAGDVHLFGHGHHHNWIFTSGRLAGAAVADRAPR